MTRVFVAYPSAPQDVGQVLERVKREAEPPLTVETWRRTDIGGEQLIKPIVEAIKSSDVIVADRTSLNFNVTYELGYALGLGKRVLPTVNRSFEADPDEARRVGIFDTLLYSEYSTSAEFLSLVSDAEPGRRFATNFPPDPSPLYLVLPPVPDDDCNQLIARGNKAGLRTRTFDPTEQPRLSAIDAIRNVAGSAGVVLPLLSPERSGATIHNLRIAFVAGLSHALNKATLLLQKGDWATPLDVRDEVEAYQNDNRLRTVFQDFAERVHEARFSDRMPVAGPTNQLASLNLGDPAAENEEPTLEDYFLERDEFRQVLDGRANVVIGRKGSGKTAVFFQVRDRLRASRSNVVVDLAPESYQLRKLKDRVLRWLAAGSKEFLLAAFWEYVLLLEICSKILEKDREVHKRNYELFEPYQRLLAVFQAETAMAGINFADRLMRLIERIGSQYSSAFGERVDVDLSDPQVTTILYKTTLSDLRDSVTSYARNKGLVYVLFDNIDKAWNATGLEDSDVSMIRSLLDAGRKLGNDFRRSGIEFYCAVFLRNDIYDRLISYTPDRGKETRALVDWTQRDLLRHMIMKRLQYNFADTPTSVEEAWNRVSVPLVSGEDSLNYLIARCLMRPRFLLALINHCKGNAINFGRSRIDETDIEKGLSLYSTDIVTEVGYEIRDVIPDAEDILYRFIGEPSQLRKSKILGLLGGHVSDGELLNSILELLLWHGVLGYRRARDESTFIYDVNYDLRRLTGLMAKVDGADPMMEINPAFWAHLEIVPTN